MQVTALHVSSQQLFRGGIIALIFANKKTKAFRIRK